jgi:serine protease Do
MTVLSKRSSLQVAVAALAGFLAGWALFAFGGASNNPQERTVEVGPDAGVPNVASPADEGGPSFPRTQESRDAAAPRPDLAADGRPTPPFDRPAEIIARFVAAMNELIERDEAVSPRELLRQSTENKRFIVPTLADPGQKLDAETLYARARPSVVIFGGVTSGGGQRRRGPPASFATGFVVHQDGIIATNAHVFEAFAGMSALGVMTDDGRVFPVRAVLAADRPTDVALMKIDATDLVPLPITEGAPVGATVYCISHPVLNHAGTENGFYTLTQGVVGGKFRFRAGSQPLLDWLAVTADYAEGSSGGPILSETGAVVGVACQTLALGGGHTGSAQKVWKFACPSKSLLALLREEPEPEPADD